MKSLLSLFLFSSLSFAILTPIGGGGGGGTPGGSNTQLQYNNSGAFGGISGATWNGTRVNIPSIQGVTSVTTNPFTFTAAMTTLLVNTGQLNSVIDLPQASTVPGKIINIVNADGSGQTSITPTPFAGDTISGNFTTLSTTPYDGLTLISDGIDKWWPVLASPSDLYLGSAVTGIGGNSVLFVDVSGYLSGDSSFIYDGQAVSHPAGVLANPGVRFSSSSGMMEDSTDVISLVAGSAASARFNTTDFIFYPDGSVPVTITSGGDITSGGLTVTGDATVKGNFYGATLNVRTNLGVDVFSLPSVDGTNGQTLITNGSGVVSWGSVGVGIGGAVSSGTANSVLFVDGSGNLAQDNTNFNYDDGTDTFTALNATITTQLTAGGLAYPTADSTAGFVLTTDGAGNLSLQATGNPFDQGLNQLDNVSFAQVTASSALDVPNFYTSGSGIAYFGHTPQAAQANTAITPASFTANTSGIADDSATWDGYTIGAVVAALRSYGLLQ